MSVLLVASWRRCSSDQSRSRTRTRAGGRDRRQVGGREDAGRRRAHVGDRVHRPVRGVRGRERRRGRRAGPGTGGRRRTARRRATRTRQPVGRRSHAGSTSVVQYQFAVNRTTSAPSLRPDDGRPLRARPSRPGARPRRSVVSCAGRRDLAGARPLVDRPARGVASDAERRAELAEQVRRPARVERLDGLPEPHLLEEHVRRVAARHVRELVDLDRLDAALQRQQRERERVGDEPGAAPRRVDRRAAARARVEHARRGRRRPGGGRRRRARPRVVTTFVPDSSSATTSSRSKTRGM